MPMVSSVAPKLNFEAGGEVVQKFVKIDIFKYYWLENLPNFAPSLKIEFLGYRGDRHVILKKIIWISTKKVKYNIFRHFGSVLLVPKPPTWNPGIQSRKRFTQTPYLKIVANETLEFRGGKWNFG